MTEYEYAYMELRDCTFNVKLPKESIDAIIQSMIDKTTLICATRAPKKCCANCKHCMRDEEYQTICYYCLHNKKRTHPINEACSNWESD